MAVESPDAEEFDRPDLRLSPEMHREQAEMALERGKEYDPYEFERRIEERREEWPDLDDAEPVDGQDGRFEEWLEASQ